MTVTVRARGPSLADFGVAGVLADPVIQLFDGPEMIDMNDDWAQHDSADALPGDLRPTDSREAVITRTLAPGAYTAIVSGVGGGTGVGIVEVFEISQGN